MQRIGAFLLPTIFDQGETVGGRRRGDAAEKLRVLFRDECLVHFIRDFNQDIQRDPWDEELKSLATKLGSLLRGIVATVDQHGLKRRHVGKHKGDVDRFFESEACASLA
jgi:hypothetical protein